jgi:hypothetical protein
MNKLATAVDTTLAAKADNAGKGAANGYASLDGTGRVPAAQLPGLTLPAGTSIGQWAYWNGAAWVAGQAPYNVRVASYQFVAADANATIEAQGGVGIPADATVNFPIGTTITIVQAIVGNITVSAAPGVTLNATPGVRLSGQWAVAQVVKRAANNWVLYGNIIA